LPMWQPVSFYHGHSSLLNNYSDHEDCCSLGCDTM
jgi:hypothetical protein